VLLFCRPAAQIDKRPASSSACVVGRSMCCRASAERIVHLVRDGRTKALAAASVTLEEFLASLPDYRPGRLERRAIVHGH
jgi:hypothetical protein